MSRWPEKLSIVSLAKNQIGRGRARKTSHDHCNMTVIKQGLMPIAMIMMMMMMIMMMMLKHLGPSKLSQGPRTMVQPAHFALFSLVIFQLTYCTFQPDYKKCGGEPKLQEGRQGPKSLGERFSDMHQIASFPRCEGCGGIRDRHWSCFFSTCRHSRHSEAQRRGCRPAGPR